MLTINFAFVPIAILTKKETRPDLHAPQEPLPWLTYAHCELNPLWHQLSFFRN